MDRYPFEILAIMGVLGLFLGIWLALKIARFRLVRSGYNERRLGLKAEARAIRLLKKNGYKILETNPRFTNILVVNGEPETFDITPDLLVRKDHCNYVVEIKSGSGDIATANIRRQVLEYMSASGLPCLLVLMPEGYIDLVAFPQTQKSR